jgi:hypothetical protein
MAQKKPKPAQFGRKDGFPTEASGRCNGSSTITADG